jgi:hypothetical protein
MTNPFRGELKVNLGKNQYNTRLTIDACMRIESTCGASLIKLATRLTEGDLLITDIANVLTPALRGGGNSMSHQEVCALVYEAGMADGLRVCGEILANVLNAGNKDEEEVGSEKKEQTLTE